MKFCGERKRRKKEKIYLVLFGLLWLFLFPSPVARMRKFLSAFLVCVSALLFCELGQSWAVEFKNKKGQGNSLVL